MKKISQDYLSTLLDEVKQILNNETNFVKLPSDTDETPQAPIKGVFYNSGEFAPADVALNDKHQHGHKGYDLRTSGGTELFPMLSGKVIRTSNDPKGGLTVTVDHGNGLTTYYAHLASVAVKQNQQVNQDTILGTVGDSGNARGTVPHTHFEVRQNGNPVDARKYFSIPRYSNFDKNKEKMWLDK